MPPVATHPPHMHTFTHTPWGVHHFTQGGSLYAVHAVMECGGNASVIDITGRGAIHHAAVIGAV